MLVGIRGWSFFLMFFGSNNSIYISFREVMEHKLKICTFFLACTKHGMIYEIKFRIHEMCVGTVVIAGLLC